MPWTDGITHKVDAWACEWINGPRATVPIRWHDARGLWDVWVFAAGVQRSSIGRMVGPPATFRPGGEQLPDWRQPEPEDPEERERLRRDRQ